MHDSAPAIDTAHLERARRTTRLVLAGGGCLLLVAGALVVLAMSAIRMFPAMASCAMALAVVGVGMRRRTETGDPWRVPSTVLWTGALLLFSYVSVVCTGPRAANPGWSVLGENVVFGLFMPCVVLSMLALSAAVLGAVAFVTYPCAVEVFSALHARLLARVLDMTGGTDAHAREIARLDARLAALESRVGAVAEPGAD